MQKYFSRKITRKFFYSFAFFLITSFLTGTILFPVKIVSLASSGNSMENSLNPLSDNSGINELSNRLKILLLLIIFLFKLPLIVLLMFLTRLTLKVPVHLLQTLDFNPLHLMPF